MVSYKHWKSEITKLVGVTNDETAQMIDSQLDEALGDSELMRFMDKMCRKNNSDTTIYLSFLIQQINAAYNESFPENLEKVERELKESAIKFRLQHGDNRPTIKEFLGEIRDYAVKNHPDRV